LEGRGKKGDISGSEKGGEMGLGSGGGEKKKRRPWGGEEGEKRTASEKEWELNGEKKEREGWGKKKKKG